MSTVASGAATMKMISSTSITSINGVTLISCISSSVSSPWSRRTLMTTHSSTLDGGKWRRPPSGRSRHDGAIEVTADEPQDLRRGIAKPGAVACDRPREHVVNHHGRNGGRKPESGRQQRLGDARGDHRKVGGMRLRDADEAVHDAPDGAEQADEGGGRADRGKHAGAAQDPSPVACFDTLEARRDPFLDAFSVGGTGRDLQLGHGRLEELHDLALSVGKPLHALRRGAYAGELIECPPHTALGQHDLYGFGEPHRPRDNRSEGKAYQYRLHHRIGVEIHAPGAQVPRQRNGGHDVVLRERRHGHGEPCEQRRTVQRRSAHASRPVQGSNPSSTRLPKFHASRSHTRPILVLITQLGWRYNVTLPSCGDQPADRGGSRWRESDFFRLSTGPTASRVQFAQDDDAMCRAVELRPRGSRNDFDESCSL